MNALQVMDRYWKEVIQVSTQKHDINVQYLYDTGKWGFFELLRERQIWFVLKTIKWSSPNAETR